jgi:glycosyltransferase involved in cell wall biosynthesis
VNILVINWQDRLNPLAGGAEVHLHEIFSRIAHRGHQVILLASGFPGASREEEIDGIHVVRTGMRNTFNFFVPGVAQSLMRRKKIDVIVEDLNKIPFFTPLYLGKPIVAILHHRFGKSIFSETILPFALYVYLTESLIPVVYRNIPFDVVSESTKDDLVTSGIPASRISIHHNGIDRELYSPAGGAPVPYQITFLGRIKKYKRIEHLLQAVSLLRRDLPKLRVMLVGDGDALPGLREIAGELSIDDITTFTGFVSPEEKVRILRQSEIVVNTSAKEGWGLTVIESNACGVPVIAANSPGLRDSVKDGYNGLLYPYGDIDALASRIGKLLRDRALLAEMKGHAIEWARRFDWETSAQGIAELLERSARGES